MKIILMLSALFIGSFVFAETRYSKDPQTGEVVKTTNLTTQEVQDRLGDLGGQLLRLNQQIAEAQQNIVNWTAEKDKLQAEIDSLNASK